MIGRIVRSADFERVLGSPSRGRSSHFVVHHLAANPSTPKKPVKRLSPAELSTDPALSEAPAVDDSRFLALQTRAPHGAWLGTVVPKRHARRAVTRSLLTRDLHAAFSGRASLLPDGMWVVRLRAPFDRSKFKSAASDALHQAASKELAQLMTHLLNTVGRI